MLCKAKIRALGDRIARLQKFLQVLLRTALGKVRLEDMPEFLKTLLARLAEGWNQLTGGQKFILAASATLAITGIILLLSWPSKEPEGAASDSSKWAILFRNVDPSEGNTIVTGLKNAKIPYKLESEGRDIYVPRDKVYEQRMSFSALGVPRSGGIGYEIFDKTNLGVTDFVQNINYRRALEGEISRTIGSLTEVEIARVHLNLPKPSLFTEKSVPPTASVVLKLKPAAQLDRKTVRGIAQLVASSVEGLKSGSVTILDQSGKVLNRGGDNPNAEITDANNEVRTQVEVYLRSKVEEMLDGVVGPGAHRVQVEVDIDFEQVDKTIESYNPEKKVVRSEQSEEESKTNSPSDGNTTRETRTANYEIDKTVMKVISAPGSTRKKVSVSVAVDGRWEKGGKNGDSAVWKSRTPEEMSQLTELVKSAVGAMPGGDNVYVTNVRFENPAVEAQVEELIRKKPVPWDDITRYGIAFLALIAGFFFLKGLLKLATEAANPPAPKYADLQIAMADEEEDEAPVKVNDMLARVEAAAKADPMSFSKLVRSWLQDDNNNANGNKEKK
jgi:flagellar M-ring protein FliF